MTTQIVLVLAIACTPAPSPEAAPGDLAQTSWVLGAGPPQPEPALPSAEAALSFVDDSSVAGSSGCNRYFGRYTTAGDSLRFGQMGSTMMACPDTVMAFERAFLGRLERVSRFAVRGDTLVLSAGDTALLVLTRVDATTLP